MLGSNLVIPVVLWGSNELTHCISSIFLSDDRKSLVTGSYDGQICLWRTENGEDVTPFYLLTGHTAPVLCLSTATVHPEFNYIVSSSECGEMCLWDMTDGKCIENVKLPQVHISVQAYQMSGCEDVRLICNGYYAEILVMDPFSLEILFFLTSKVNPDWISALHILRPSKRKDDVVLAITTTGVVKVWTLIGNENKYGEPIYENESKQIRCLNAITMKCCAKSQRTVLLVCAKYWQIYDAGDFTILSSLISPIGERWMGGDFLSTECVILWSDSGKGYLYQLPSNSIPEHSNFHQQSLEQDAPVLYCVLSKDNPAPLSCPPAMQLVKSHNANLSVNLIMGDSAGLVTTWKIPSYHETESKRSPIILFPFKSASLRESWHKINQPPVGILDDIDPMKEALPKITCSTYLPHQSRLVIGRDDGTILIVPATQVIALQLLNGPHQNDGWPPHQALIGHDGRVNCLLCPSLSDQRYEKSHLISGGVDFSVILWDLNTGALVYRFCVHAGEITQLFTPPQKCSARIQKCICSVASDHSVALLSLQERKCITLASRHFFPIVKIKWRPLDDFLVIGCSDGSVHVWQMETGHLDRICQGMLAEEVLSTCDELTDELSSSSDVSDSGLVNPALHLFRGLRHRNLTAIKQATQRGIHELQKLQGAHHVDANVVLKNQSSPLVIQGMKTNPKDAESHILFFDIEGLIFELHREEYLKITTATLTSQQKQEKDSLDPTKKISDFFGRVKAKSETFDFKIKEKDKHGFLAKVKEGAENIGNKVQEKVESVVKNINESNKGSIIDPLIASPRMETTHVMEVARLILSFMHSWGQDKKLDQVCENELGLLRPLIPLSFGILSKGGYMSLLLPTWQNSIFPNRDSKLTTFDELTYAFTSRLRWELSSALTTHHLLAMVSLSNTLLSMQMASFLEKHRGLFEENYTDTPDTSNSTLIQIQIKQGWSLLSTHHCFLLPDKLNAKHSQHFQRPQVEMMARRWQHHCIEIREAAQQLLLGELERMGRKGRKQLVESWSQFLPLYTHSESIAASVVQTSSSQNEIQVDEFNTDDEEEEEVIRKPSSLSELKRKQTTAVVLLGIIGAEFGEDMSSENKSSRAGTEIRRESLASEVFSGSNNNLPRLTAMALSHLVLAPPTSKLPAFTPLRRAAIDLIGRGFVVWEPYIDVSKVLLGLLELCCDSHTLLPNMNYKLPLNPQADACRTARHSLRLIATARPAAFITTMAREVARYNTAQQNAQTLSVPLTNSILHRAKPEILQCIEMLIEKLQAYVSNLLIEVTDIILHCVDINDLKNKGLHEVCPTICKYNQISHCGVTRRIAAGAINGNLAVYELRQSKCQMIPAHSQPVTAIAFSPDGKYLVSYSCGENRLCFWQTSSGMFGLGQSQTRCVKNYSTAPIPDVSRFNPMRLAKLIWISNKIVTLMLADGSETRFNI